MVWRLAEQHVQGVRGGEGKDLKHHIVLEGVEIMIWRPGAEASIVEKLGTEASILRGSGGEAVTTRVQCGEITVTMRLRGVTRRPGGDMMEPGLEVTVMVSRTQEGEVPDIMRLWGVTRRPGLEVTVMVTRSNVEIAIRAVLIIFWGVTSKMESSWWRGRCRGHQCRFPDRSGQGTLGNTKKNAFTLGPLVIWERRALVSILM